MTQFDDAFAAKMQEVRDVAGGQESAPAPAVEPPAAPAVEPAATPESAAPSAAEQALILGKFKSQDDLVSAYQQLEQRFHQERQPEAPPAEPEQTFTPILPFNAPSTVEEIYSNAQQHPAETVAWLGQNYQGLVQGLGPQAAEQIATEIGNYWMQVDPLRAHMHFTNLAIQQSLGQYQQQIGPQIEPIQQHYAEQVGTQAETVARSMIPDYDQYRERIFQAVGEGGPLENWIGGTMDPNELARQVARVYDVLKGQEVREQLIAQAAGLVTSSEQREVPLTLTRSSAQEPPSAGDPTADFAAYMKARVSE